MGEQDYLFYTYSGNWDSNTLNYSTNYPNSLIFHPTTKRFFHNGVLYGSGEGSTYFVKGNNSSGDTTGAWTGTHNGITEYYEGLSVIFLPNVAGNTTGTSLNINNIGAKYIYFNGILLKQQYPIATPILLTYVGDASTGYWKTADITTTPVDNNLINGQNDYYVAFSPAQNGFVDIKSIASVKYNITALTLYAPNFSAGSDGNGSIYGNLIGNADTATALANTVTLWGQNFDGTNNVKGSIVNTGHIVPEFYDATHTDYDKIFDIGTSNKRYQYVYGDFFDGRANGVKVANKTTGTIYLLGQTSSEIGNNSVDAIGDVYSNTKLYFDCSKAFLYTQYLGVNENSYTSQFKLKVNGDSNFNGDIYAKNGYFTFALGVGTDSPEEALGVIGNGSFSGYVNADGFKHRGLTPASGKTKDDYVLLAGGGYKEWNTSASNSTIVSRTNVGDIYTHMYFTDITNETVNSTADIGGLYFANTTDQGIHRMSIESFKSSLGISEEITITKSLTVTEAWMDTGIVTTTGTNGTFPEGNGTYIVQVSHGHLTTPGTNGYASIYSGIMTIYNGTNATDQTEEIILHRSGHAWVKRIYLRTVQTATATGYCKIQIAASSDWTEASDVTFKFKKVL